MAVGRSETGQHQPRPSEACHHLLPNQRPMLERHGLLRNRLLPPSNTYLFILPVDLVAPLPWYVLPLTVRYTSMPVQQSPQKHGKFSPYQPMMCLVYVDHQRLPIDFTRIICQSNAWGQVRALEGVSTYRSPQTLYRGRLSMR